MLFHYAMAAFCSEEFSEILFWKLENFSLSFAAFTSNIYIYRFILKKDTMRARGIYIITKQIANILHRKCIVFAAWGSVLSDDTINCSNLASGNRRISILAMCWWGGRKTRCTWQDACFTNAYLSALLTCSRTRLCYTATVKSRVKIFHWLGKSSM